MKLRVRRARGRVADAKLRPPRLWHHLAMVRAGSLVLVWVAALHGTAHAGLFCGVDENFGDPAEARASMKWIEAYAKTKTAPVPENTAPWLCARTDAVNLKKRIVAACTTILDRDGDKSECVDL